MVRRTHLSLNQRIKSSPINPRTGCPWTLVDKEVIKRAEAMHRSLINDPAKARDFLVDCGLLTRGGKLPRRYAELAGEFS